MNPAEDPARQRGRLQSRVEGLQSVSEIITPLVG